MDDSALWRELFDEEDNAEAQTELLGTPSVSACQLMADGQQSPPYQLGPPASTQPWPHTPPIPGLALVRCFLSPLQQEALLAAIHQEGWFATSAANQAMVFGALPGWAQALAAAVPAHLLGPAAVGRVPLFDQLIANRYTPGEGLAPHVDLARFQDGICVLSLGSPALMAFTPAPSPIHPLQAQQHLQHCRQPTAQQHHTEQHTMDLQPSTQQAAAANTGPPCATSHAAAVEGSSQPSSPQHSSACHPGQPAGTGLGPTNVPTAACTSQPGDHDGHRHGGEAGDSSCCHKVLLAPGDLLLLAGEARYGWCHGLAAVEAEVLGPLAAAPYVAALAAAQQGAAAPMPCVGTAVQQQRLDIGAMPQEKGLQELPCVESHDKRCVATAPGVYCQPDGGLLVVRGQRVSVTLRALQPDCELCEPADEDVQVLQAAPDAKAPM